MNLSVDPYVVTSLCFSFFVIASISLAYYITDKMVLFKRLELTVDANYTLCISFMVVNSFHPDLIFREIWMYVPILIIHTVFDTHPKFKKKHYETTKQFCFYRNNKILWI